MIALHENQPVSARVRLTDDDYLRTRYYLHPDGTADIGRRKPSVSAAGSLHNGLRRIVVAESAQTRPQFGKEINYVLHEHKDTISLRIPHVFPEVVLFL